VRRDQLRDEAAESISRTLSGIRFAASMQEAAGVRLVCDLEADAVLRALTERGIGLARCTCFPGSTAGAIAQDAERDPYCDVHGFTDEPVAASKHKPRSEQ
jgi:hypothetical protein